MKQLTCEMCGSTNLIKQDGLFVCQSCGCKYSTEEAKKMMIEGTVDVSGSTIKVDNKEELSEQISIWEKMAGDAFNNSNYAEAYTFYCKILEKRVDYWFATYRKGLSLGWQGNLKNMHINEVLGGIVDATKLLYSDDTQTDLLKANGSLIMATELYNWIQAISNLAVNHCNQYGSEIVSAAKDFYQEECLVSEMIKINMNLLTEFVYNNYEDKDGFERLLNAITSFARTTINNMNAKFRIKTGRKWNSFWGIYEDVFQDVYPDYKTVSARNELNSAVQTLERNFAVWKRNYSEKIALEKAKALEARRRIFWENNPSIYNIYENKCKEMNTINSDIQIAKKELSKAEQEYEPFQKKLQDMNNTINTKNSEINRLHKRIFGKKKAEEQISILEREISAIKEEITLTNPERESAKKKVDIYKNNLKRLEGILSEIKKDIDNLARKAES